MSSEDLAVRAEGIGKEYRLGTFTGTGARYRSLREDLVAATRRRRRPASPRTLWALRDVSFEIHRGERVGVIGRNGAGKSTLLKILARISAPSQGWAEVRGRLGSLLEVGTGFHPELTGRDNIMLSGAIHGMRRAEILAKVDDIVAFAGVDAFLETPVKRYSSGMYLRLAFAVAAYLEPEVLLVDEVLAVGDAEFQKKCLGRMSELGAGGRTVLFVSHSMPSVLRLCERVLLLDSGGVVADGDASAVVRKYLDSGLGSAAERHWVSPAEAPGDELVRLKSVRVLQGGEVREDVDIVQPVSIEVEYWQLLGHATARPSVNIHVSNEDGVILFVSNDFNDRGWAGSPRHPGIVRATCLIPADFLAEGRHFVLAAVSTYNPTSVHAMEVDAVSFHVIDRSKGEAVRGEYVGEWPGVVRPRLHWQIEVLPSTDAEAAQE